MDSNLLSSLGLVGLGLLSGLALNQFVLSPAQQPAASTTTATATAAAAPLPPTSVHSVDTTQLSAARAPAVAASVPAVEGVKTDEKALPAGSVGGAGADGTRLKMMLVVRHDLKMEKGKIAAQCSHAAVGLSYNLFASANPAHQLLYHRWTAQAQPKIVVKVKDENQLLDVQTKAEKAGINTYLVIDAGRTQVAPNSRTVLAIGPASAAALEPITKPLDLL